MGILNALRTGDPFTDMMLALLFPMLLELLSDTWRDWMPKLVAFFFPRPTGPIRKHQRTITYEYRQSSYGGRQGTDAEENLFTFSPFLELPKEKKFTNRRLFIFAELLSFTQK